MNDLLLYVENNKRGKLTFKGIWKNFKSHYPDVRMMRKESFFKKEIIEFANENNILKLKQRIYLDKDGNEKSYQEVLFVKESEWGWEYLASRYRHFHRQNKERKQRRLKQQEVQEQEQNLDLFCKENPTLLTARKICTLFGMSKRSYFYMVKKRNISKKNHKIQLFALTPKEQQQKHNLDVVSRNMWRMDDEFSMHSFLLECMGIVDNSPHVNSFCRIAAKVFKHELRIKKIRRMVDGQRRRFYVKPNFERDCAL
jgi:uncharacterized protein YrzB (UPF0473 family)